MQRIARMQASERLGAAVAARRSQRCLSAAYTAQRPLGATAQQPRAALTARRPRAALTASRRALAGAPRERGPREKRYEISGTATSTKSTSRVRSFELLTDTPASGGGEDTAPQPVARPARRSIADDPHLAPASTSRHRRGARPQGRRVAAAAQRPTIWSTRPKTARPTTPRQDRRSPHRRSRRSSPRSSAARARRCRSWPA